MRKLITSGFLVVLLLAPIFALSGQTPAAHGETAGRPASVPTAAFTQRSGLSGVSLSPNGSKVALRAVDKEGKTYLSVLDAGTRAPLHNLEMPAKQEMEWFQWAGNNRILVSLSQVGLLFKEEYTYTRLFVFDLATGTFTFVGKRDMGIDGDSVIHTDPAGEFILLLMQRTIADYPSVWRFPLDGTAEKAGKQVQAPRYYVWRWFADDAGVVRLAVETLDSGNLKIIYRRTADEEFRTVATVDRVKKDKRGTWLMADLAAGSDEGWVLEQDDSDHYVLKKVDFSNFTSKETVVAKPGSDVEDVWFDDNHKLVAAFWSDDRDRVQWFDPVMQTAQTRLEKALKGTEVTIDAKSRDGSRMIVWSGRENDPGAWYIYTPAAKKLDLFFAARPQIDPAKMATPKPIKYTARDGLEIQGILTLPPGRPAKDLPLIVMPHGGPFGVHDQLTFDNQAQFLANRGYAVLQPNFRGSSGRGDDYIDKGEGEVGRKMQDDVDDGMDWVVKQGIADPKRVCVVGGSYGGYAAMWAVIRNPERYRCAASFAGVTDWNAQLRYSGNYFSRESRRELSKSFKGTRPGFNFDDVSPAKQAAKLTRPLLLVHGERDFRVPFKQFTAMKAAAASAGKPIEVLVFPDEGHGFDKAENETKYLDTLEAFLARHNPAY
ncbi:MAG: alpha/beta hydrolase family protein [Novosphingobium sp.]